MFPIRPFLYRDCLEHEEGGNDGKPQNEEKCDEDGSFGRHARSGLDRVRWVRKIFRKEYSKMFGRGRSIVAHSPSSFTCLTSGNTGAKTTPMTTFIGRAVHLRDEVF